MSLQTKHNETLNGHLLIIDDEVLISFTKMLW